MFKQFVGLVIYYLSYLLQVAFFLPYELLASLACHWVVVTHTLPLLVHTTHPADKHESYKHVKISHARNCLIIIAKEIVVS